MSLKKFTVDIASIGFLPSLVKDYLDGEAAVQHFSRVPFSADGIVKSVAGKNYPAERRKLLAGILRKQYQAVPGGAGAAVSGNIDLLEKENTYTVTTGHQLN